MWTIPIISGLLYLIGGQWWKIARWVLIGTYIFFMAIFHGYPWWTISAVLTYLISTNCASYGDNMLTSKIFGRWVSMGISGFAYGLASIVVLGVWLGLLQAIIGCVSFLILKWLDDKEVLKNPWQELFRGALGTCLYIFIGGA